ncbi:unnamed protein product, partial [Polarella glacialis]
RHEERLALQHSVLPHWEVWLSGNSWPNWESFAWPKEVRLAAGNLLGMQPDPNAASVAQDWKSGDFAWHDPSCRQKPLGSKDRAGSLDELCEKRRLEAGDRIAPETGGIGLAWPWR